MPHADVALAGRLEALAARDLRRFVSAANHAQAYSEAEVLEIAGGVAAFLGRDSLVNRALGLGFERRVTVGDADAIIDFFAARQERANVSVCPLADGSVLEVFGAAGFVADAFENVLVRRVHEADAVGVSVPEGAQPPPATLEIREVLTDEERAVWAFAAATGFSAPFDPLPQQLDLARTAVMREGARLFMGWVDGRPAATAEMTVTDDVAWFSADSTLPHFRGLGIQGELQRHRLALAARAGCAIAVTESHPGSPSQRNMERHGFAVVYTRVDLLGPQP